MNHNDIVIVEPRRTAIGAFHGSLSELKAVPLGTLVVKDILKRTGLTSVQWLIAGNILQLGSGQNPARQIIRNAGINKEEPDKSIDFDSVPAKTINFVCGSGLQAVIDAAEKIISTRDWKKPCKVILAGGVESMTNIPFYVPTARWGARLGNAILEDTLLSDGLVCPFTKEHMGVTAENLAKRHGVTRGQVDAFAVRSQKLAAEAIKNHLFDEQIVPIEVKDKRQTKQFVLDENVRPDVTLEGLAKIGLAFVKENGIVTAGNSSGINDGASFMIVTTAGEAERLNLQPMLRLVSYAAEGVEPGFMGYGPVPASRRALEEAGLEMKDMDVVEINEAFAVVPIVCARELGVSDAQLNPHGGAVAFGHPVGATGAILVTKLAYELKRIQGKYGLVSLCCGGGMGITAIFERL